MPNDLPALIQTFGHWLVDLSPTKEHKSQSLFFELYPLTPKTSKSFRIMLPLEIFHYDCLPTFERCRFSILIINGKFDPHISDLICNLLEHEKNFDYGSSPRWVWRFLSDLEKNADSDLSALPSDAMAEWLHVTDRGLQPYLHEPIAWSIIRADSLGHFLTTKKGSSENVKVASTLKLKAYCRKLYLLFANNFVYGWSKERGLDGPQPPHFGLTGLFPYPQYCGFKLIHNSMLPVCSSKMPLLCIPPVKNRIDTLFANVKGLLQQGPYAVTIPLFAYTLFSLIKPFFPEYPARLDPHMPYRTVARCRIVKHIGQRSK